MEAAVFRHVDYLIIRLGQLLGGQLKAVVYQVGVKAFSGKVFKQFHKIAFGKAAAARRFLEGQLPVIAALDVVEGVFQAAVG